MKLSEAIRKANESGDVALWRSVLAMMRFRMQLNYQQSLKKIQEIYPNADLATYDEICYAVDNDALTVGVSFTNDTRPPAA